MGNKICTSYWENNSEKVYEKFITQKYSNDTISSYAAVLSTDRKEKKKVFFMAYTGKLDALRTST